VHLLVFAVQGSQALMLLRGERVPDPHQHAQM
jgi:hypothetical protein